MTVVVGAAFLACGSLNSGVVLEIASTPVSAVQPCEKACRTSVQARRRTARADDLHGGRLVAEQLSPVSNARALHDARRVGRLRRSVPPRW